MLYIACPWCGLRDETEYHYGGEAHIIRPDVPAKLSDSEWAAYLFMRANHKGIIAERWVHASGCRRWFNVLRSTINHEILCVYKMGEMPPAINTDRGHQTLRHAAMAAMAAMDEDALRQENLLSERYDDSATQNYDDSGNSGNSGNKDDIAKTNNWPGVEARIKLGVNK